MLEIGEGGAEGLPRLRQPLRPQAQGRLKYIIHDQGIPAFQAKEDENISATSSTNLRQKRGGSDRDVDDSIRPARGGIGASPGSASLSRTGGSRTTGRSTDGHGPGGPISGSVRHPRLVHLPAVDPADGRRPGEWLDIEALLAEQGIRKR